LPADGVGVGRAPDEHARTKADATATITTNGTRRTPGTLLCDGCGVMDTR
jgi:hypothetical protein